MECCVLLLLFRKIGMHEFSPPWPFIPLIGLIIVVFLEMRYIIVELIGEAGE